MQCPESGAKWGGLYMYTYIPTLAPQEHGADLALK